MAVIQFGAFEFKLTEGERACILLPRGESPIAECVLTGQNKISRDGKRIPTAEGRNLLYRRHTLSGDRLEIVQESEALRSTVVFQKYPDCNVLRVYQRIENRAQKEVRVSQVSSFVLYGLDGNSIADLKRTHLYRFFNSWHCECQPQRYSLFDAGLYSGGHASFRRVYGSNKGSWSTKEELPQAIIEHEKDANYTMFQIESANSWYWGIGECEQGVYLYTGGADAWDHEWEVRLAPGESYCTPATAVCTGSTLNGTVAEMTKYRRHLICVCPADKNLPVVFNEYMHLSWDSPTEERTRQMAPVAASLGADIYVIDCGWHNEEDGEVIYPYVGQWRESHKRYPHGIAQTISYIHSLGMKAGLWLEPEIVGQLCGEMISHYPADAWMSRDGVPVVVGGRRFLDYRCKAVREYMDAAVDRIVKEYGADYLKFDYNQDCGAGTDAGGEKAGRGLELASEAFFGWVKGVRERYPDLIIEGCASGGQRLDYRATAAWSLVSSSDQTDYRKYPWIAANILAGILPEQAGVWSYPVDSWVRGFQATAEWVQSHVSDETVAMNMVNAMLGRVHLASHVELLTEFQKDIVREGVSCSKKISGAKTHSVPWFPKKFARFGDKSAAGGFIADGTLYLAVWNTGGRRAVSVDLSPLSPIGCKVLYPLCLPTQCSLAGDILTVKFSSKYAARFFALSLKEKS